MPALTRSRATVAENVACFLLCIPSGGVLLAHIYGILPMYIGGWAVALPSCLLLAAIGLWGDKFGRSDLSEAIVIGFLAGLLGTILYDLARVPVLFAGRLVFAPIELYGVWLLKTPSSSRFTELTGWLYHFSNGITFGIMYALWMRGRHWIWGIAWALVLETIFVVSPLAHSVALFSDYKSVLIAYYGHIAYGLGVGWVVQRWDASAAQVRLLEPVHKWILVAIPVVACAGYLFSSSPVRRDARTQADTLRVEGIRLNPDWTRLTAGTTIHIENPTEQGVSIRLPQVPETLNIAAHESVNYDLPKRNGLFEIYQIFVMTQPRSRSSFVIVEPPAR